MLGHMVRARRPHPDHLPLYLENRYIGNVLRDGVFLPNPRLALNGKQFDALPDPMKLHLGTLSMGIGRCTYLVPTDFSSYDGKAGFFVVAGTSDWRHLLGIMHLDGGLEKSEWYSLHYGIRSAIRDNETQAPLPTAKHVDPEGCNEEVRLAFNGVNGVFGDCHMLPGTGDALDVVSAHYGIVICTILPDGRIMPDELFIDYAIIVFSKVRGFAGLAEYAEGLRRDGVTPDKLVKLVKAKYAKLAKSAKRPD